MRVFDASALLAVLFSETGGDRAAALLEEGDAVVSAVNQGEVVRLRPGVDAAPEVFIQKPPGVTCVACHSVSTSLRGPPASIRFNSTPAALSITFASRGNATEPEETAWCAPLTALSVPKSFTLLEVGFRLRAGSRVGVLVAIPEVYPCPILLPVHFPASFNGDWRSVTSSR